jgi:hypothetical protein
VGLQHELSDAATVSTHVRAEQVSVRDAPNHAVTTIALKTELQIIQISDKFDPFLQ